MKRSALLAFFALNFVAAHLFAAERVLLRENMDSDTSQWIGQKGDGSVPLFGQFIADPLGSDKKVLRFDKKVMGGDFFSKARFKAGKYRLSFDYLGTCPAKNCGGVIGISSDFPGRTTWLAGTAAGFPHTLRDSHQWQHYDLTVDAAFNFHLVLEHWVESAGAVGSVHFAGIELAALDEKGGVMAAGASTDYRNLTLESKVLQKPMRVQVYLPQGYDAKKKYPVLYWLPAFNNSESDALYNTGLGGLADELIAKGQLQPMIIVAPQADNSWYTNTASAPSERTFRSDRFGEGRYEDYLLDELIPWTEKQFAVDARPAARWIGGISMGGYGAVALALRHPTTFSRVGGHSPAILGAGRANYRFGEFVLNWLYPDAATRSVRDPMLLVKNAPLDGMQFWLDAGEQDFEILKESKDFAAQLKLRGAQYQFSSGAGGHDSFYWNEERLNRYLRFYGGI
ncbi:alpha/beta hydrolase-fold protein [Chitinibacter sp. FCG-7]|uniref:Alpha/beta hydrolase-fold protein n=1 Tax=Chitinibacter mangrovi TaxID=3153927 RepID=A0AAU7FF65_9NEIS